MRISLLQNSLAALTRLYPFYSGAATFANHPLLHRLVPSDAGVVWAKTAGGEVLANLGDFVGRAAFFVGDLDPKLTWVARRILRPGDVALDVGANIGIMTLLFSRLVGQTGHVHAFEPNPDVAADLKSALSRAGATNVTLNEVAVGREESDLTLKVPEGNRGAGSLVRGHEWASAKTYNVRVTTLDQYVMDRRIEKIGLLKIDIEGFEIDLFRGATHVLSRIEPRAIVFEDNAQGKMDSPVIDFLLSNDYALLSLPKAKLNMRARLFTKGDSGHDFVAAKRGRPFDSLCEQLL